MMKNLIISLLLLVVCHGINSIPLAVANNAETGNADNLDAFASELKRLQDELQSLREVNKALATSNNGKEVEDDTILTGQEPLINKVPRGVGWQPLKRLAEPENRPYFQLGLKNPVSVKQQIINAVEDHLLEDLRAAQEYGVEPQQILSDLRTKNNRNSQNSL